MIFDNQLRLIAAWWLCIGMVVGFVLGWMFRMPVRKPSEPHQSSER